MIGAFATDQPAVFESCTVGSTAAANGALVLRVELAFDDLDIICDDIRVTGSKYISVTTLV